MELVDVRQFPAMDKQRRRRSFQCDAAAFGCWQCEGDDGRGCFLLALYLGHGLSFL